MLSLLATAEPPPHPGESRTAMPTAIVTGASMGLGQALAHGLARAGWSLVIDARGGPTLSRAAAGIEAELTAGAALLALPGDVTDAAHRVQLARAAAQLGGLELVVNNASALGPTPLPPLTRYSLDALGGVLATNVLAPLGLIQATTSQLGQAARARVLNIASDASVEAYPGWGGYGASKAALDQLSAVLAIEQPGWRVWAVDPGDLRTRMHQDAFPDEDISDRPEPATVVPSLLTLIESDHPSGRVRPGDLVDLVGAGRSVS
jgi:NAD(P)-dependent dehydrogenase (short-subunit alcohol dehydrogenase family)